MKFNLLETKEITDFEEEIGVELVVTERPVSETVPRYLVRFDGAEILDAGILSCAFGAGATIDIALDSYTYMISGRKLVVGADSPDRREIDCPNLRHTKILGR